MHCRVKLIPPAGRIVDIEQPSFASPQNMIAYCVSFDLAAAEEGGADDATNKEAIENMVVAERAASKQGQTRLCSLSAFCDHAPFLIPRAKRRLDRRFVVLLQTKKRRI